MPYLEGSILFPAPGWDGGGGVDYPVDRVSQRVEAAIRNLHRRVGNVDVDQYHLVLASGGVQALDAAIHTMAKRAAANATSDSPRVGMYAQAPHYPYFKLIADSLGPSLQWGADSGAHEVPTIEIVTSPNNPDGRATSARMDQSHAELRIHDHVYNWPSFVTAHTSPSSSDWPLRNAVMIFSLSKLTGHAGTRFGWALVAKFDVAKAMATHVWLKSGGPPGVESQMRAASIIRRVTQSVGTSNDFFEWVHTEMGNRYTVLESIFAGQQKFALLSERGSACAWLRCPPHGDTCANRLRKVGIVSAEGENFGADSAHARVCVASHRSSFDIVARRLDMLVRQEQDREYERWQCPDCPFNFD